MPLSCSRRSRPSSAKPASVIDPRSPPLPLTASTRTASPVNGSGSSIFELVLPPPKFVIRKSAPSRFDRYRRSDSGRPSSASASRWSQRSLRWWSAIVSGIGGFTVLLKTLRFSGPFLRLLRVESLCRERSVDDRARVGERRGRAGGHDLDGDVPESGGLGRSG